MTPAKIAERAATVARARDSYDTARNVSRQAASVERDALNAWIDARREFDSAMAELKREIK